MVRVRGLKFGWRGGGLDEALSSEAPKESAMGRPGACRLVAMLLGYPMVAAAAPLGIDLGEV